MQKKLKRGFTLIELMIVVAILGILAAVAIPAFIQYMRTAKSSEATQNLDGIHKGASSYFGNEWIARGMGQTAKGRCLPSSVTWTPSATPTSSKYIQTTVATQFTGNATWAAFNFVPQDDFYYHYQYTLSATAGCNLASNTLLTYQAEGDLDGDGVKSLFERQGIITSDGTLSHVGGFYKQNPNE